MYPNMQYIVLIELHHSNHEHLFDLPWFESVYNTYTTTGAPMKKT